MITTIPSDSFRESHPPRLDAPFLACEVPLELARMRADAVYEREGHAGKTLAKYPDLRVVLETMKPGVRMPLHRTGERMALHVLLGQLRLWMPLGESHDLAEGSFAAIDAGRILEIECLHECAFLMTLAWPPAARAGDGVGGDGAGI